MLIALFPVVSLVAVFVGEYFSLSSSAYEMDNGNGTHKGAFIPFLILYQVLFYIVAGLGIFGAIYARSAGVLNAPVFFLASAICAILFNILLILFYESYLHVRYPGSGKTDDGLVYQKTGPSNYTRGKYALILSLGASAILTLICGAIQTAAMLR